MTGQYQTKAMILQAKWMELSNFLWIWSVQKAKLNHTKKKNCQKQLFLPPHSHSPQHLHTISLFLSKICLRFSFYFFSPYLRLKKSLLIVCWLDMAWNLNTYRYTKLSGITKVRTQEPASKTEYFTPPQSEWRPEIGCLWPPKRRISSSTSPRCADWGWHGAPRSWRCYCLAQGGPEVQCHWRQMPAGFYGADNIPGAGGIKKAGRW